MRVTFIAAKKAEHPVTSLCRCLCVTRSGCYAWQARPESLHARNDRRLKVLVHTSFAESRRNSGSPRVHDDLIDWQEHVSRKRVVRLMQEEGLKARVRKRYTPTTMSDHDQPVAANLLDRRFEATAPNQRWGGDTTEFVIATSGKLYLAVILDLFSRVVVGWALSAVKDRHLTITALERALKGVVARIVTGPHDANRQDPHLPMRYDAGRPRAVIRLRISQPRTTSLPCPAGLRARRPSPMMDL